MARNSRTLGAGTAGAGAGLGICLLIVRFIRWVVEVVFGRIDKKQARVDHASDEMFDRLQGEVSRLAKRCIAVEKRLTVAEADLAVCKQQHAESNARVMELEAQQQGYGNARQEAARIIAAEKAEAKK